MNNILRKYFGEHEVQNVGEGITFNSRWQTSFCIIGEELIMNFGGKIDTLLKVRAVFALESLKCTIDDAIKEIQEN